MRPRIIGVKTCRWCRQLVKNYTKQKVDFEYWDGERDDLQDTLDKMNIDDFPIVQIIDDDGKVLYPYDRAIYPRGVSYNQVKKKIEALEKNLK